MLSTPLEVCIHPARWLNPWYTKNWPQVTAPYAFKPSSLATCTSARKKNDVWGLIHSSAWPEAVFEGAMAKPFDPAGSSAALVAATGGELARRSPLNALSRGRDTRSMSQPILPSLNVSAIQGSNRWMTLGVTCGCLE